MRIASQSSKINLRVQDIECAAQRVPYVAVFQNYSTFLTIKNENAVPGLNKLRIKDNRKRRRILREVDLLNVVEYHGLLTVV